MCYCEDDEDISEDVIYPWDKEEPETESRDFELIPDEPPEIPRRPAKDSKPPEPEKKPEPENKPGPETRQEKAPEKKPSVFAKIAKYFRECRSEVKKIVWPTPKATFKNVGIVLSVLLVVGLFVYGLDTGFIALLKLIMDI